MNGNFHKTRGTQFILKNQHRINKLFSNLEHGNSKFNDNNIKDPTNRRILSTEDVKQIVVINTKLYQFKSKHNLRAKIINVPIIKLKFKLWSLKRNCDSDLVSGTSQQLWDLIRIWLGDLKVTSSRWTCHTNE